jgi:hypothetical protein
MSKGLASLIAVLGAGMGGYARGKSQYDDEQRRTKEDARRDDEYNYAKGKRDSADSLDQRIADSQKDIAPAVETNTGATYADPALMESDNRENRRNFEQTGMAAPAPMTAMPTSPAAQQAMMGTNSRASKLQRAADIYAAEPGQMDKARQYEEFARKALDEGADKTLAAIAASAPTLDAVKKAGGIVTGTIGKDTADIFNKTGSHWKVGESTPVQHFIAKDAAGREFVNSRVMGKDGKEVVGDVVGMGKMLLTAKERMDQSNKDTGTYQVGQQIEETARAHKASEKDRDLTRQQSAAQHAASMGIQRDRLQMAKDSFKRQTLTGQIEQIESAIGVKLSTDERKSIAGIKTGKAEGVDQAFVNKLTEKWSENNPQAAPPDVAKFRHGLVQSLTAVKNNGEVEATLKASFAGLKPGTPAYANTWNEAKALLKVDDKALTAMGYAPPPAASKAPIAARAGTAMAPSSVKPVWQGPGEQAAAALDAAMQNTGRAIAQASAAGNAAEVQRLTAVMAEQNAAKQAALGGGR